MVRIFGVVQLSFVIIILSHVKADHLNDDTFVFLILKRDSYLGLPGGMDGWLVLVFFFQQVIAFIYLFIFFNSRPYIFIYIHPKKNLQHHRHLRIRH